jgi:hypothetical protein
MRKRSSKKLHLSRETLLALNPAELSKAMGGMVPAGSHVKNECDTDSCVTCQNPSACPCP